MGLCVFSLPTSLVMIERIDILCPIIIIKAEVWTITHSLGLDHDTMVCAVCLSIFLFLSCVYTLECHNIHFKTNIKNKVSIWKEQQTRHKLLYLVYWKYPKLRFHAHSDYKANCTIHCFPWLLIVPCCHFHKNACKISSFIRSLGDV